jgi:hypothetical protein
MREKILLRAFGAELIDALMACRRSETSLDGIITRKRIWIYH